MKMKTKYPRNLGRDNCYKRNWIKIDLSNKKSNIIREVRQEKILQKILQSKLIIL